jgi:hypothetical protein
MAPPGGPAFSCHPASIFMPILLIPWNHFLSLTHTWPWVHVQMKLCSAFKAPPPHFLQAASLNPGQSEGHPLLHHPSAPRLPMLIFTERFMRLSLGHLSICPLCLGHTRLPQFPTYTSLVLPQDSCILSPLCLESLPFSHLLLLVVRSQLRSDTFPSALA